MTHRSLPALAAPGRTPQSTAVAEVEADFPGWTIAREAGGGRWWASRLRMLTGPEVDAGMRQTVHAADEGALRVLLAEQTGARS